MKKFTSKSQKTGQLGENIGCTYLIRQGFKILERNYTKKWGEIDIVAQKGLKTYFIEVKSVSCENFMPEDQMHYEKRKRLMRIIRTYIQDYENKTGFEIGEWQFDVMCIFLDHQRKIGHVRTLDDIILS